MNVSREVKKAEAVGRMKLLHLFPETIRQFEQENYVSLSEPPVGAFFWIDDEGKEAVRKFEDEYNALVYVGIRAYTTIGVMDSFLYVSDHKEEWCADRIDLQNKEPLAYVVNWTAPDCSEIGAIGIEPTVAAGLQRVW